MLEGYASIVVLYGRNAARLAGAPLDLIDQEALDANSASWRSTSRPPSHAHATPCRAQLSPPLPLALQHSLRHAHARNVSCLVMCCRG